MSFRRAAVVCACALLALLSCTPPDWSDFQGVNLISGLSWADWTVDQPAGMSLSAVTDQSFEGAPAFRLELVNLIPNGDFEAASTRGPSAGWTATGTGDTAIVVDSADATLGSWAISGNSLYFAISAGARV